MAAPSAGKTTPPIPHVSVKTEVAPAEPPASVAAKSGGKRKPLTLLLAGVAVLVLAGGGFFAWQTFMAEPPPPPPVTKKTAPAPTKAPATAATPAPAPTPSETLNKIASTPGAAVKKAQEAVAAKNAQVAPVDAVTSEAVGVQNRPAVAPATPAPKAPTAATGSRTVAPGVVASTALEAAPEASVAFRNFVSGAKINGVVATRAIINGRLTRSGETIDVTLGITFEGYDSDTNQLLFKDRSGALVARRYP